MKKKAAFELAIYIVVIAFVFLAGCGSDESAPADPSTTSVIPDIVFFNTVDLSAVVLFEGRAFDNFRVQSVELSFNGASWNTADIDPPGGDNAVEWSYLASIGNISANINTIVIRATDSSGNMSVSDPVIVERQKGSTIASLLAVFVGPAAASTGDVIGLSSGIGGAYGDGLNPLTIPITTSLTVIGSGYGDTRTSGGHSPSAVASTATILESDLTAASLFSVQADFTLKKVRLIGARNGIRSIDSPGSDPILTVEEVLFDAQDAWAIFATDDNAALDLSVLSTVVDASSANSSSRGGLYLDNVSYYVFGSEFYYHTDPLGPADTSVKGAAIQAVSGNGQITSTLFDDNALAIWASGGSPVITSCNISGAAFTTNGINLTEGPATPVLRHNKISNNSGYGLRIGGSMMAKIRASVFSSNQWAGIYIDFSGSAPQVSKIDLGKTLAGGYSVNDPGNNDLFGNGTSNPDPEGSNEVQVYVSSSTNTAKIPAVDNYWGENIDTPLEVNQVIRDGNDFGLLRGFLDPSPFFINPQN